MIGNHELFEGINKVLLGPQKKSRLVTESDKRITAYHESGHAIIAKLCKHCDPVQEVSIIARGMAAGYTMTRPDSDDNHMDPCKAHRPRLRTSRRPRRRRTRHQGTCRRVPPTTCSASPRSPARWSPSGGMSERVGLVTYQSDSPIFLGRDMEAHNSYSEGDGGHHRRRGAQDHRNRPCARRGTSHVEPQGARQYGARARRT